MYEKEIPMINSTSDTNMCVATGACKCGCGCRPKAISWTAILAGALVGMGLTFLLNTFSIGIGLSLVRTTEDGLTSLAIGGFIGLLIGAIVSMFAAGFTAGCLGK